MSTAMQSRQIELPNPTRATISDSHTNITKLLPLVIDQHKGHCVLACGLGLSGKSLLMKRVVEMSVVQVPGQKRPGKAHLFHKKNQLPFVDELDGLNPRSNEPRTVVVVDDAELIAERIELFLPDWVNNFVSEGNYVIFAIDRGRRDEIEKLRRLCPSLEQIVLSTVLRPFEMNVCFNSACDTYNVIIPIPIRDSIMRLSSGHPYVFDWILKHLILISRFNSRTNDTIEVTDDPEQLFMPPSISCAHSVTDKTPTQLAFLNQVIIPLSRAFSFSLTTEEKQLLGEIAFNRNLADLRSVVSSLAAMLELDIVESNFRDSLHPKLIHPLRLCLAANPIYVISCPPTS